MTKSQKNQEEWIKRAVKKYGKEKVIQLLTEMGMIQKERKLKPLSDDEGVQCDPGYYYSETLQKCVLDIGEGHGPDL